MVDVPRNELTGVNRKLYGASREIFFYDVHKC